MIKVYQGKTLREGAKLALKHRLYVSGWCMNGDLKAVDEGCYQSGKIALKFVNNIPVAIAFRHSLQPKADIEAFCRKEQRRNGYASECVKTIVNKDECIAGEGLDAGRSRKFWQHCGIAVW